MKFLLKIFTIFSSLFFSINCFAEDTMPYIETKEVNLEKAGVVAEFNINFKEDINVEKQEYYSFYLNYIYSSKQYKKELEELREKFPTSKELPQTNIWKIFDGIIGDADKKGSKIVLKLTITPLFDLKEDYKYFNWEGFKIGGDSRKSSMKKLIENPTVIKSNKPFEHIIDLSEYSAWDSKDTIYPDDNAAFKPIVSIQLPKGAYNIKLENLKDVPEINAIKTTLAIVLSDF